MKKTVTIIIITIILVILILSSLIAYASTGDERNTLEEKVSQELKYLNQYFISMLGDFNGLTIGDNRLQENEPQIQSSMNTGFSEQENQTSGQESQTNEQGNQTSGQGSQSGNQGNQNGGQNQQSDQSKESLQQEKFNNTSNKTDTSQNSILANNGKYKTDWPKIQMQVEQIYQVWDTVSIDLYTLNIDGRAILSFNDVLNRATQAVKDKDKTKAMDEVMGIYAKILDYKKAYNQDTREIDLLTIQYNTVAAYTDVTNDRWENANKNLAEAEKLFSNILNTLTNDYSNQAIMSQSYILVNELRKAVNLKDKEIFYIEYRNLMNKMEMLLS